MSMWAPTTKITQTPKSRDSSDILLEYMNRMGAFRGVIPLFFLVIACAAQTSISTLPIPRFEDVSQKAGLTVSHDSTPEKRYILESMSGGVGFIDSKM